MLHCVAWPFVICVFPFFLEPHGGEPGNATGCAKPLVFVLQFEWQLVALGNEALSVWHLSVLVLAV